MYLYDHNSDTIIFWEDDWGGSKVLAMSKIYVSMSLWQYSIQRLLPLAIVPKEDSSLAVEGVLDPPLDKVLWLQGFNNKMTRFLFGIMNVYIRKISYTASFVA